jgi:cell division transport system ATP-binding protein
MSAGVEQTTEPIIRLGNLTKTYRKSDKPVLDRVDLTVDAGEFVFVIGSSGAGKSTLLKLLMAETKPTSGTGQVAGSDLRRLRGRKLVKHRQRIGVVFQDFRLLEDRTVAQNVAFGLNVLGRSRREIRARVPEILDQVGLAGLAGRYPSALSGGEQQRVAIARAVAGTPDLLIADEPTGNLDPDTTAEIIGLFEQLNRDGLTIIMATHNVAVVDAAGHRVVRLDAGRVVRDAAGGYTTTGPADVTPESAA